MTGDIFEMVAQRKLTVEEAVDLIMLERELRKTPFERFLRFLGKLLFS